jgi:hypothetical protein
MHGLSLVNCSGNSEVTLHNERFLPAIDGKNCTIITVANIPALLLIELLTRPHINWPRRSDKRRLEKQLPFFLYWTMQVQSS